MNLPSNAPVWGQKLSAFSLAELLISLLILGEIATFTIPKLISSQQNQRYNAIAKEFVGSVAAAYQNYKASNTVTDTFGIKDLTPYLNYSRIETGTTFDSVHGQGTLTCDGNVWVCMRLHNGALVDYGLPSTFGSLTNTGAVYFHIDPDGRITDGTTNGPGKGLEFWLFYNGRIASRGDAGLNACQKWAGGGPWCYGADPAQLPSWFSWNN